MYYGAELFHAPRMGIEVAFSAMLEVAFRTEIISFDFVVEMKDIIQK